MDLAGEGLLWGVGVRMELREAALLYPIRVKIYRLYTNQLLGSSYTLLITLKPCVPIKASSASTLTHLFCCRIRELLQF